MKLLAIFGIALAFPLSTERRIGSAQFHIERVKDEVLMEPLIAARFQLVQLKGEHAEPTSIVRCSVWVRPLDGDPRLMTTVLKCGENEYAVEEVDFVYDGGK